MNINLYCANSFEYSYRSVLQSLKNLTQFVCITLNQMHCYVLLQISLWHSVCLANIERTQEKQVDKTVVDIEHFEHDTFDTFGFTFIVFMVTGQWCTVIDWSLSWGDLVVEMVISIISVQMQVSNRSEQRSSCYILSINCPNHVSTSKLRLWHTVEIDDFQMLCTSIHPAFKKQRL